MLRVFLFLAAAAVSPAFAQDTDPLYRVGNGVTPPSVLRKVEPEYSREGERERIQGTAVYSLIVDKNGRARDIELISPIGYGLDEKGLEAIQKWLFKPGEKDGRPVNVRATIEVNFRFRNLPFDEKAEGNRTSYNAAMHNLAIAERKAKAIETIEKLAAQKYPPAMSLLGEWMMDGSEAPKDVAGGIDLIRKAADKYDRNGVYALGLAYIKGLGLPMDTEKGLKLMREASVYGSQAAQLYLGTKYDAGDTWIPRDEERARYYFRLCAARGAAECQFQLGRLLMPSAQGKGDAVQASAWLALAHDGSVQQAEPLLRSLQEKLSPEEKQRAEKLKTQLIRQ
jgi:TonB family protein